MKARITVSILLFFLTGPALMGQEYFQQEVNYNIQVTLNDQDHYLRGFEKIQYTNHAPEALEVIHFHLWPNAYKNNQTTLARELFRQKGRHYLFKMSRQKGFIDSLNFKVNGDEVNWHHHPDHIDICTVELNEPLESGETIEITTPFRVKIPLGVTSRLGHMGQSYKITQWHPKPAVYDHRGWHAMPYRNMGEFYSEYGDYEVSITLPDNYVVAATGDLKTREEQRWLAEKAVQTKGQFSFDKTDMDIPASSQQDKTIRYTIENTHDFAWFADKRYHVMRDSVKLPGSGRQVTTWAFFTNDQAELWRNATGYINDAITRYSRWYGDYAYDNCTAILGAAGSRGNGMEYPTITAIGHQQSPKMLEQVIMHEVGHNWFYGMLGFNERRYPFLDEGINTFSEIRYMENKYPDLKLYQMFGMPEGLAKLSGIEHMHHLQQHELMYLLKARTNSDQPTNTSSSKFSMVNYAAISYSKAGLAFRHLKGSLGETTFNQTMQDFFQQWKFKHPYPLDLAASFREHTDNNLEWFFDSMLKSSQKMDYKIKKYQQQKILVKNKGQIAAPLVIEGRNNGEKSFTKWYPGFNGTKWLEVPDKKVDQFVIDPDHQMLELYRHNNRLRTSGLFKKTEPLKLEFMGVVNNPRYTQIHLLPAIGWNYYDKAMLGLFAYDALLPPDRFDYYLAPMYSTSRKNFSGLGEVGINLYPDRTFRKINLKVSGKQFGIREKHDGAFNQLQGEATFTLDRNAPQSRVKNKISYALTYASKMQNMGETPQTNGHKMYHQLSFLHDQRAKSINPYHVRASIEYGGNFLKGALEASYKISYYHDQGLTMRLFGGSFIHRQDELPWFYGFHLSGSTGLNDYTFDRTYLGRYEDPTVETSNQLLSQQFYPRQGAFALYSPLGITRDWLMTLNINSSLPLIQDIPIEAYANVGAFGAIQPLGMDFTNKDWAMETGIKLSFLQFLDIYFPIAASNNLERASDIINTRYGEKIRFHLKFDLLDPSRITDQFDF